MREGLRKGKSDRRSRLKGEPLLLSAKGVDGLLNITCRAKHFGT